MQFMGLNPLGALRQRLNMVVAVAVLSAGCCACGGLMTFVLAPNQALRANRIARLPQTSAADVEAAAPGTELLIAGQLAGNTPVLPEAGLVAYSLETWTVSLSATDEEGGGVPQGRWVAQGSEVPRLNLEAGGPPVTILPSREARLSGPLREWVVPGDGRLEASYQGESLTDGTQRYRGLADGDLATVLGHKDASGGIVPGEIFAGGREAFETSQRQAASGLLFSGIAAMVLSPVVLAGGLLAALFGRRR